jgi:RNA polymerase sigma-70 factor (ECF subfamily)
MVDDLEGDLLGRFVQGEQGAFESLFRRHEGEVFRWILRIVRDRGAAEDVAIEAFWRAYRGRARFDSSRSFGAWMRRIATNAALDHLRSQRGRTGWAATDDDTPAPAGTDGTLRESIALAFRRLSPRLRVVATLALVEQQPYAEIADALDLPVGTVKSRVFRAVRSLREELARLGIRP